MVDHGGSEEGTERRPTVHSAAGPDAGKTGGSVTSGRKLATRVGRRHQAIARALSGHLLSVANLVGVPVLDADGDKAGRLHDVVVRWDRKSPYPPAVAVLVNSGRSINRLEIADVTLRQKDVRVAATSIAVSSRTLHADEFSLAEDLLDHQLVDVAGVEVVRAADLYLANRDGSWELEGIDVGLRAYLRRVLPRRRSCPPPSRSIGWSQLQAFVPRDPEKSGGKPQRPAAGAGMPGTTVRLAQPASQLHRLRVGEVVELLSGLGRAQQAQLVTMADSEVVADALERLDPKTLDALMAELEPADQAKLLALTDRRGDT